MHNEDRLHLASHILKLEFSINKKFFKDDSKESNYELNNPNLNSDKSMLFPKN